MRKAAIAASMVVALVGSSAMAADMALKAPPRAVPPAPVYNWTGFYVGVNAGGVCSDGSADPGTFTNNAIFVNFALRQSSGQFSSFLGHDCGFIGGGQVGYNFRSMNWVWGVEADIQGTSLNRSDNRPFPAGPNFDANTEQASQRLNWLGTVRGRLGFLTTPTFLIYGTGGLAYGEVTSNISTTGIPNGFPGVTVSAGDRNTKAGWTAGGGVEWAFFQNWSAKVEGLWYRLNSDTVTLNYAVLPGGTGTINYSFKNEGFIIRAGLDYKLGW